MDKTKVYILFIWILLLEFYFLHNYITPIQWGQIKIEEQSCENCTNAKVVNGQWYLNYITPDSLKHHEIDYSSIEVVDMPYYSNNSNVSKEKHTYYIEGNVVGLKSTKEGVHLLFKMETFIKHRLIYSVISRFIFIGTLLYMIFSLFIVNRMNK